MNALLFCIDFCVRVCMCVRARMCAWEGFLMGFAVNKES